MADLARLAAVSARAADAAIAAVSAPAALSASPAVTAITAYMKRQKNRITAVPACNGNDAEALVRQLQRKRLPVRAVPSVRGLLLIGAAGPDRAVTAAFPVVGNGRFASVPAIFAISAIFCFCV